jgi:4'-phosphopantetheinyl transferase
MTRFSALTPQPWPQTKVEVPQEARRPPHVPVVLGDEEVHIWRVEVEQFNEWVPYFVRSLSSYERARAEHYCFDEDRIRFIISRGILRILLSNYSNVAPNRIVLQRGFYGKPFFENQSNAVNLQFNITHSAELALYAVTQMRRVGIDIEYMREIPHMYQLVLQLFSPREQYQWMKIPQDLKRQAFLKAWTGKEAYVKTLGLGFIYPLNQVEIALGPDITVQDIQLDSGDGAAIPSRMLSFQLGESYQSALVVEGKNWNPCFFQVSLGEPTS